ncbi:MAG: nucleotide exchange factor GrpE [Chitinophagales bacterium]
MQEKDAKFSGQEPKSGDTDNGRELDLDINTDENVAGSNLLNDSVADEDELEKLRGELQAQKDKYLRLFADFDNYRKRSAKERIELIQTAGKEVISSLLDVLDDCDRAEKQLQSSSDIQEIREGVMLVFNKLRSVMQSKGLKPMESIHSDFDVETQEAVSELPAPTAALKGKVLDEITKGYYLNDKIIRFAKVIVGK